MIFAPREGPMVPIVEVPGACPKVCVSGIGSIVAPFCWIIALYQSKVAPFCRNVAPIDSNVAPNQSKIAPIWSKWTPFR